MRIFAIFVPTAMAWTTLPHRHFYSAGGDRNTVWIGTTHPLTLTKSDSKSSLRTISRTTKLRASSILTTSELVEKTQEAVTELKKVLEREYISFFDPMKTEYYTEDVSFQDPLTSLVGISAYRDNVDMLSGRTLLGSILFEDASINLHSVSGGIVHADTTALPETKEQNNSNAPITIDHIITRWTLRFTMKVWPWKPTARFSGISVYKVQCTTDGSKAKVQIVSQQDYWDSINLKAGGSYQVVEKGTALADFLNQLKPGGFQASMAAPELPYSLLRRGREYEVRKYPAYYAVQLKYTRRDEGFGTLGAFTSGIEAPMGPAIMDVAASSKYMQWPLTYAAPGSDFALEPTLALAKLNQIPWKNNCEIVAVPAKVIAVAEFSDASLEPVVRKADRQLRESLQRDALQVESEDDGSVSFAQYDAIFSMGKRRGEVWIQLKDGGHPWS